MSLLQSTLLTELKTLVRLALPLLVAQFAQTANGFVDTVMAGQISPEDLAAVDAWAQRRRNPKP